MKETLHVGFLTPEYSRDASPEGGLANYLRKVSLELCRRGQRVSVFCLSKTTKRWNDGEIRVHEVKRFHLPHQLARLKRISGYMPALAQVLSARGLEKTLWKVHRADPLDIIQASSYKSPGYTLRGNIHLPLVSRISSYSPLWGAARGQRRTFAEYLCNWLEIRQVLDACDAFAPSEFIANVFARFEAYRPRVIRTMATLEDIQLDPSFYEQHLRGEPYLLYFGTLNGNKGVDLLAPVVSRIAAKYANLKFVFIGPDNGLSNKQRVFDFIQRSNEPQKVRLFHHPPLPKAKLYPVIQNSLGVLMPSRVDNLPNACLEAQALGIPVVGTLDSSLDEMITEGETGFLARNGDWESICAATERLLGQTPSARAEMRGRIFANVARAKAEDRVGQLVEFYHSTIANWRIGKPR